jgi:hypothetical protein
MKKLASLAVALLVAFGSAGVLPAAANQINVVVHTHVSDVGQIALSAADAPVIASASSSLIAGLNSTTGNWTNNVTVGNHVDHVLQIGVAAAKAAAGNGTATATVQEVTDLSSTTLTNVNDATIKVSSSAKDIVQGGLAIAIGGYSATASTSALTGVSVLTVN